MEGIEMADPMKKEGKHYASPCEIPSPEGHAPESINRLIEDALMHLDAYRFSDFESEYLRSKQLALATRLIIKANADQQFSLLAGRPL